MCPVALRLIAAHDDVADLPRWVTDWIDTWKDQIAEGEWDVRWVYSRGLGAFVSISPDGTAVVWNGMVPDGYSRDAVAEALLGVERHYFLWKGRPTSRLYAQMRLREKHCAVAGLDPYASTLDERAAESIERRRVHTSNLKAGRRYVLTGYGAPTVLVGMEIVMETSGRTKSKERSDAAFLLRLAQWKQLMCVEDTEIARECARVLRSAVRWVCRRVNPRRVLSGGKLEALVLAGKLPAEFLNYAQYVKRRVNRSRKKSSPRSKRCS